MINIEEYVPTLIKVLDKKSSGKFALYRCICGNEFETRMTDVNLKKTRSCGCLQRQLTSERFLKHGKRKNREYAIWQNIKNRCYYRKGNQYNDYGGRGIDVCDRWLDKEKGFENFYEDMGDRPSSKHSIDRIDNNKGYSKENCRWATLIEQGSNKRNNNLLEVDGITKTVSEWAREVGIKRETIRGRIKLGWSIKDSIFGSKRVNQYG